MVLVAADSAAKAFVDDVLDELGLEDGQSIAVCCGKTCLSLLGTPEPRRLLILDGAPPDLGVGSLVETVRMLDRTLPILIIRYGWAGPPQERDGVRIEPGPLVSRTGAEILQRLLVRRP